MPVVPARLSLLPIHALLHNCPGSVIGDEESMQIEIEAILHRCAVHLGHQAASARERQRIDANPITEGGQLIRRTSRMLAASPAHMDAEFVLQRGQAALQGTDNAGGDAGGMPVHAHDGTEGLEPEWMRQPTQEFIPAVVMND